MVILVAMMLAAVGMMRSVDTSVAVVGNISFKRAADEAASQGVQAIQAAMSGASGWSANLIGNPAYLDNNGGGGGVGYYASIQPGESAQGVPALLQTATNTGVFVNGPDAAGNTTRTMVERMCSVAGAATATNCPLGGGGVGGAKTDKCNQANELNCFKLTGGGGGSGSSVFYRVSVRVDGPNSTVSFVQAFILL